MAHGANCTHDLSAVAAWQGRCSRGNVSGAIAPAVHPGVWACLFLLHILIFIDWNVDALGVVQALLAVVWTLNTGAVCTWMPFLYQWQLQPARKQASE